MRVSLSLEMDMVSFFLLLLLGPVQLETLHFDVNVRAVKHSEICQLIFFLSTLLSMFGGLTGCLCFGIIIIMSGIRAETGALSACSRLKPFPAFVLFLFQRERERAKRQERLKQEDPSGLINCWNLIYVHSSQIFKRILYQFYILWKRC